MKGGPGRDIRTAGFTLVELIVALTLLSVGVLGLSASTLLVALQIERTWLETEVRVRVQAELEAWLADGSDPPVGGIRNGGTLAVELETDAERPRRLTLIVAGHRGREVVADTVVLEKGG